jgi:hypothetical protein
MAAGKWASGPGATDAGRDSGPPRNREEIKGVRGKKTFPPSPARTTRADPCRTLTGSVATAIVPGEGRGEPREPSRHRWAKSARVSVFRGPTASSGRGGRGSHSSRSAWVPLRPSSSLPASSR